MSKNKIHSWDYFDVICIVAIVCLASLLLILFITPIIAKANPATPRTTLVRVACNTSNERYLEVYKLNHNGRKFLITKGWSNSNYGGVSTSIIELK